MKLPPNTYPRWVRKNVKRELACVVELVQSGDEPRIFPGEIEFGLNDETGTIFVAVHIPAHVDTTGTRSVRAYVDPESFSDDECDAFHLMVQSTLQHRTINYYSRNHPQWD